MLAQPAYEVEHVGVAPHPLREPLEARERLAAAPVFAPPAHVAVDAVGVRPVGLDRHGRKAFLFDEPLRDLRALAVELVRAVRRLAEQHEPRVADESH